jgi:hypothetical protein
VAPAPRPVGRGGPARGDRAAADRTHQPQARAPRAELGDPRCDSTDELRAATARRLKRIARQERLRAALRDDGMPAAATLAMDFAHAECGSLERLERHAQRLENHFYKAMRELRAHRKEKRADGFKLADAEPYADLALMTRELDECEDEEARVEEEQQEEDAVAEATASSARMRKTNPTPMNRAPVKTRAKVASRARARSSWSRRRNSRRAGRNDHPIGRNSISRAARPSPLPSPRRTGVREDGSGAHARRSLTIE